MASLVRGRGVDRAGTPAVADLRWNRFTKERDRSDEQLDLVEHGQAGMV